MIVFFSFSYAFYSSAFDWVSEMSVERHSAAQKRDKQRLYCIGDFANELSSGVTRPLTNDDALQHYTFDYCGDNAKQTLYILV